MTILELAVEAGLDIADADIGRALREMDGHAMAALQCGRVANRLSMRIEDRCIASFKGATGAQQVGSCAQLLKPRHAAFLATMEGLTETRIELGDALHGERGIGTVTAPPHFQQGKTRMRRLRHAGGRASQPRTELLQMLALPREAFGGADQTPGQPV